MQRGAEAPHIAHQDHRRLIALPQRSEDDAHRQGVRPRVEQVRGVEIGVQAAPDPGHRGLCRLHVRDGRERSPGAHRVDRQAGFADEGRREAGRRGEGDPCEAELSYDHAVKSHALRVLYASLLCTAPGLGIARADGVRLTLEGVTVPYAQVEYVLAEKRGTVVAESNKRFAARFGRQEVVAVLTRADLDGLLDRLARDGIWTLRTRRAVHSQTRWTIEVTRGDRRHAVVVDDPETRLDGRHLRIIERVRARVNAAVPQRRFQDPMLLPKEGGTLNLRTLPIARVRLDGVWLPTPTPIRGLRVQAGRHRLEFLPLAGGAPTPYDIAVEAGRATSLNLKLE